MRYYLHADDMGLSADSDHYFFSIIEAGHCHSISLLANGENFENAAEFLKRHEHVRISVHMNLTEGQALSGGASLQGMNYARNYGDLWGKLLRNNNRYISAVHREIDRQVAKIVDFFGSERPLSLDGHMHVHMLPPLMRALPELCGRYNLTSIRCSRERLTLSSFWSGTCRLGIIKNLLLNTLSCLSAPVPFRSDCVIGILNSGNMTKQSVEKRLSCCSRSDLVEVILHPAYLASTSKVVNCSDPRFYSDKHRLVEYELFKELSSD